MVLRLRLRSPRPWRSWWSYRWCRSRPPFEGEHEPRPIASRPRSSRPARNVNIDDGADVLAPGRIAPVQRASLALAIAVLIAAGIDRECERDRGDRVAEQTQLVGRAV